MSKIQFLIHVMINGTGFVQIVLNSWKILEMCPAIFQTWKNPRNGKKSWVYFLSKLQQLLYKLIFSFWSNLNQSRAETCSVSRKKLCSCIFGGLYWSPFWWPWVWEKKSKVIIIIVWKNVWTEKVMNFGSKNLYKP